MRKITVEVACGETLCGACHFLIGGRTPFDGECACFKKPVIAYMNENDLFERLPKCIAAETKGGGNAE